MYRAGALWEELNVSCAYVVHHGYMRKRVLVVRALVFGAVDLLSMEY